jgi:transposase
MISDVDSARVEALLAEGMSIRDIAAETGIPRSTMHRLKKLEWDASDDPGGTAKDE